MTGIVIGAMVRIIKFGVYLALTGCLVTCTMEPTSEIKMSVTSPKPKKIEFTNTILMQNREGA